MAIKLSSRDEAERYLLSRQGYGQTYIDHQRYILVCRLSGGKITYDKHDHGHGVRTLYVAHDHIEKNWDSLKSGDVICVETILGERTEPKKSERFGSEG